MDNPHQMHEQLLDDLRPVVFAIAYRMLGGVADAEDVVQETLLRVHQALEAGKRLDMGKCCLHFKQLDDLELTSVATVIAMSTPKEYLAYYRRVKGLDAGPMK